MFLGQKGFTLIEVVIATGIMGVLAFGLIRINKQFNITEKRLTNITEINDFIYEKKFVLNSSKACSNTFNHLKSTLKKDQPLPITTKISTLLDHSSKPYLEEGKQYGKVYVEKIRTLIPASFKNPKKFPPKLDTITIFLDLIIKSPLVTTRKVGKISYRVYAQRTSELKDVEFISCHNLSSQLVEEVSSHLMKKICKLFNLPFDDVSGDCSMGQTKNSKNSFKNMDPKYLDSSIKSLQEMMNNPSLQEIIKSYQDK